MAFWDDIRKDAERGIKEGIRALKLKAEELTDEGKRKIKLFELKGTVHGELANLGSLVYGLSAAKGNPLENPRVKRSVNRLRRLEARIKKLEKPVAGEKASR